MSLYDDLKGIRSIYNQVNSLGKRNKDAEGHGVDFIADLFYPVTLHVSFHRREEKKDVAAALA